MQTIWLQHDEDGEASLVFRAGGPCFRLISGRSCGLQCESKLVQYKGPSEKSVCVVFVCVCGSLASAVFLFCRMECA